MAFGVVLVMGIAGGFVRLLPWLVAPDVPLRLSVPFARLLFGSALEAALLVGLPVGAGVGAALFVERGEARALSALGARPERLVASLLAPGLLATAAYVVAGSVSEPEPPGRLADRLLQAGLASCADVRSAERVDVPLVGVSWLCFPRARPRLVGRVPGIARDVWFSAASLSPSDELRAVSVRDLRLLGRIAGSGLEVRLHATRSRILGLPGWGRSHGLTGRTRAGTVALSAFIGAVAAAWWLIRRPRSGPMTASAVTGLAAVLMLSTLRALDAHSADLPVFALVPAVGVAGLFAGFAVSELIFGSRVARRALR